MNNPIIAYICALGIPVTLGFILIITHNIIKRVILIRKLKNTEIVFTDSQIIHGIKGLIYPLSYKDIKFIARSSKSSKGVYKKLIIGFKEDNMDISLHDIVINGPLDRILRNKHND